MSRLMIIGLLSLHLMLPLYAWAQAKPTPLDYPLKQYVFIIGVAMLGGLVGWYTKVKRGEIPLWSIHHLTGELATSALAGLLSFWLCEWAGMQPLLTAALTGIAGHAGAGAITALEQWASKRLDARPIP